VTLNKLERAVSQEADPTSPSEISARSGIWGQGIYDI
jgi:hypothetical protein